MKQHERCVLQVGYTMCHAHLLNINIVLK